MLLQLDGDRGQVKMDFVYDSAHLLNIKPINGEEYPEISIIERNPAKQDLIAKLTKYCDDLKEQSDRRCERASALMKKSRRKRLLQQGSPKVRDTVYQAGNRMMVKLFLTNCGKRLQGVGNVRYSTRFLEAAYAIDPETTPEDEQNEIARLLDEAYTNMGQYRVEMSVLSLEKDLFGTNDSKAVSCELLDGKLIAKREFNVGDVVFIDKPLVGYVKVSRDQCNCCLIKTLYTVPCVDCCSVFYCSVSCMRNDAHYHNYECHGYKLSLFPSVDDDTLVLRMFVKAMDILKRNALERQQQLPAVSTMTPQQLWDILLEDHKHSEDFLKVFQASTCDHFAEDNASYQIFLQKVSFFMHYFLRDNQIAKNYLACWTKLKAQCLYKFMKSVLLRILCITKLNKCSFSYDLQFDNADTVDINPPRNRDGDAQSERYVIINNQYIGMYRFQTEMGASTNEFNTIFTLLHHGTIMFRASKKIKKGDALVLNIGTFPTLTSSNFVPINPASLMGPSASSSDNSASIECSIIEKTDMMIALITELEGKGLLYTADNFHDILTLFDCFIVCYQRIPEAQPSMVVMFSILTKLETLYRKARLFPSVLTKDYWMSLLLIRGVKMQRVKQDYIERLVNNLHQMYYQS